MNVFSTSFCSSPNFSHSESTNSSKTISLPFSLCTKAYAKSLFKQIAKFAGIVQGVVVQITNDVSVSKTPFPSFTANFTKIVGLFTSLYSISASARAVSLDGDQ